MLIIVKNRGIANSMQSKSRNISWYIKGLFLIKNLLMVELNAGVFEYKYLIFGFSLLFNKKQKLKWFILFSFPFEDQLNGFYNRGTIVDERLKVHS